MFWQIMGKPGGAGPEGDLKAAIERDFGGLEKLQEAFNTAGTKVFGSGWVFVTVDKEGKLALQPKPNQDTPLMDGGRVPYGQRRVGARLLPQVSEQTRGLSQGLVECRELVCGR